MVAVFTIPAAPPAPMLSTPDDPAASPSRMLFALTTAPLLTANVPLPLPPTVNCPELLQREFAPLIVAIPVEPLMAPSVPSALVSRPPLLILSVPLPCCPTEIDPLVRTVARLESSSNVPDDAGVAARVIPLVPLTTPPPLTSRVPETTVAPVYVLVPVIVSWPPCLMSEPLPVISPAYVPAPSWLNWTTFEFAIGPCRLVLLPTRV